MPNNETEFKIAVATVGPMYVAIDASQPSFQSYKLTSSLCSSTNLNHTVLVAGYGTYKREDYWLIKNR